MGQARRISFTGISHQALRRFIEQAAFAKLPNLADMDGLLG